MAYEHISANSRPVAYKHPAVNTWPVAYKHPAANTWANANTRTTHSVGLFPPCARQPILSNTNANSGANKTTEADTRSDSDTLDYTLGRAVSARSLY